MIKEAYCSFELAKLLKEKGFPINEHLRIYTNKDNLCLTDVGMMSYLSKEDYIHFEDFFIPTITHQMAMKWLREKHKLYIGINIEVGDIQMLPSYDFEETVLGYNFVIYNEETLIWVFKDKTPRSYEEAVEAALKYSLANLI